MMVDRAEAKHELILEHLVRTIEHRYGPKGMKHLLYDNKEGHLTGELDLVVRTDDSIRVYEVKGTRKGFKHGTSQLLRACYHERYWSPDESLRTHYTLVTWSKKGGWTLERVKPEKL